MVNDVLNRSRHSRAGMLVRFQSSIVNMVKRSSLLLIDVGAGSGNFLFHNRERFRSVLGIEVSPECVRYAAEELNIPIQTSLRKDCETPSVVTFWHSLEHIPVEGIEEILARLGNISDSDTRLVVSVPNNRSFQYRLFNRAYTYYDAATHLHQFSPRSLDLLMRRHGFQMERAFFSPAYIAFGYMQGFLNIVTPIHNYLYYRQKRGVDFGLPAARLKFLDFLSRLMLVVAIPAAAVCSLADLLSNDSQGVLTRCYKKIV